MWRWLSTLVPSLIIATSLLPLLSVGFAAETSAGPTSTEEAQTIWLEGQKAFTQGHYSEAARNLQRLVDRYPGDLHHNEAIDMLGTTYFKLKQPKRAIPLMVASIERHTHDLSGQKMRLRLGRAYLLLDRFDEALLVAREIEGVSKSFSLPRELLADATLLKGQALLAKNRLDQAQLALLSLTKDRAAINDPKLLAQVNYFKLSLGLEQCRTFSQPGPLTELQVKEQTEKRADCLIEKLGSSKSLFAGQDSELQQSTVDLVERAFGDLKKICFEPPRPPTGKGQKRTPQELKRYQDELAFLLKPYYKRAMSQAQSLLRSWQARDSGLDGETVSKINQALQQLDAS